MRTLNHSDGSLLVLHILHQKFPGFFGLGSFKRRPDEGGFLTPGGAPLHFRLRRKELDQDLVFAFPAKRRNGVQIYDGISDFQ
jgi:hypothetical protein